MLFSLINILKYLINVDNEIWLIKKLPDILTRFLKAFGNDTSIDFIDLYQSIVSK